MEILKLTFREQGQLLLGNNDPTPSPVKVSILYESFKNIYCYPTVIF